MKKIIDAEAMADIGVQFAAARREKNLSVEDVVHNTRIRPHVIQSLEAGDFSAFSSPTYAKGFIRQYGEFLGIDVTDVIADFDSVSSGESVPQSDLEVAMVGTMKEEIRRQNRNQLPRAQKRKRTRTNKPAGAPILLGIILGVVIVAIALFYILGYQADSPEELREEITNRFSKVGLSEQKNNQGELAGLSEEGGKIERNPLLGNVNKDTPSASPDPESQSFFSNLFGKERPALKDNRPTAGGAPTLDLNNSLPEDPVSVSMPKLSQQTPPNQSENPAQLRPPGTDPPARVREVEEEKILKAIPVIAPQE